jgi:hypothetical protein
MQIIRFGKSFKSNAKELLKPSARSVYGKELYGISVQDRVTKA